MKWQESDRYYSKGNRLQSQINIKNKDVKDVKKWYLSNVTVTEFKFFNHIKCDRTVYWYKFGSQLNISKSQIFLKLNLSRHYKHFCQRLLGLRSKALRIYFFLKNWSWENCILRFFFKRHQTYIEENENKNR